MPGKPLARLNLDRARMGKPRSPHPPRPASNVRAPQISLPAENALGLRPRPPIRRKILAVAACNAPGSRHDRPISCNRCSVRTELRSRPDRFGAGHVVAEGGMCAPRVASDVLEAAGGARSEEHTSELQSLMRISYAVICLKNTT